MKDNKSSYNSSIYDESITTVLPYYTEFHGQVIDMVKMISQKKDGSIKWLDTGCGTGTLALRAFDELSDSNIDKIDNIINVEFTLCDPSEGCWRWQRRSSEGRISDITISHRMHFYMKMSLIL